MYTTREPTLIFHDRRAVANTGLRLARSTGHASVEWVMGRRPTVLREATKVGHEIKLFSVLRCLPLPTLRLNGYSYRWAYVCETFNRQMIGLDHAIKVNRWQHPATGRTATFAVPVHHFLVIRF